MEIQMLVLDQEKPIKADEIPHKLDGDLYLKKIENSSKNSIFKRQPEGTLIYLSTDPKGQNCSCDVLTGCVHEDENKQPTINEIKPDYIPELTKYIKELIEDKNYNVIFGMVWARAEKEGIENYKEVNLQELIDILNENRFRQDEAYFIKNKNS